VWSAAEQALYWVDILAPSVHRWHPASGESRTWPLPSAVGSLGLRAAGGLVLAMKTGFHLFDPENGALEFLVHPEPDRPTNRLNDGKVAPDGSFWAGTMDDRADKQPVGALYRLGTDRQLARMSGEVKVSNGLAWSPDGRTLYHSDSRGGAIWQHSHDPDTGSIGPRRPFVTMPPEWGRPDGGAVDAEGCYWGCGVGAGRINRFSPDGELMSWIDLPLSYPTMPCFGGPDLRTLYVTSLSDGLTPAELAATPLAGTILSLEVGVAGTPVSAYRG
jgi:sugar lactone lactonase YvrE